MGLTNCFAPDFQCKVVKHLGFGIPALRPHHVSKIVQVDGMIWMCLANRRSVDL